MRQRAGKAEKERIESLFDWCEQNARGSGELGLSKEEKEEMKENELSKTVFYDDDIELYRLTRVFLQIPFDYSGMGGAVGKKYEAIKDFLKWNGFKVKEWTSIVHQMGVVWVGAKSESS